LDYVKTDKRFLFELRFRSDYDLALFEKFVQGSLVRLVEYQGADGKVRFFATDTRMPDNGVDPWRWVEEELPRIGAAIGMHFPHFVLPKCRCIIDLDHENGPSPIGPYFKVKVLGTSNMPAFQSVMTDNSSFGAYADKCEGDGDFREALLYLGQALDVERENRWFSLYRAYEIVADRFGGKDGLTKCGLCSKNEVSRFTNTSNHQEAIGAFSRHARLKTEPPSNPMDIDEAIRFVSALVRLWHDSEVKK